MDNSIKEILINHKGFAYVKSRDDKLIMSCDLIRDYGDGIYTSATHSDDFTEWAINLENITEIIALLY